MHRTLHEDAEDGSLKKRVGEILESRWVEVLIVLLVIADICLVVMEVGIEEHFFCINGKVVTCPEPLAHRAGMRISVGGEHGIDISTDHAMDAGHHGGHHFLQASLASGGLRRRLRAAGSLATSAVEALPQLAASAGGRLGVRGALPPDLGMPFQFLQLPGEGPHGTAGGGHHGTPESVGGGHEHAGEGELCPHPGEKILVCESRYGHHAMHMAHTCHSLSVLILCVMMIELLVKWWVNPEEFCSNFYHKLDLFVTSISLLLDTIIFQIIHSYEHASHKDQEEKESVLLIVSGLILLARTWRVLRICHGIFEELHVVHEMAEENKRLKKTLTSHGLDEFGNSLRSEEGSPSQ